MLAYQLVHRHKSTSMLSLSGRREGDGLPHAAKNGTVCWWLWSVLAEVYSETRAHAQEAFERFLATWKAKYPRAIECLAKDREELLPFYYFPAVYWQSLRTTNPIESTFATIRLRTAKTRNCLSEKTALSLVHQLAMSAEKRWRRLRGFRHLADVIAEVRFTDGMKEKETGGRAAEFRTAIYQICP